MKPARPTIETDYRVGPGERLPAGRSVTSSRSDAAVDADRSRSGISSLSGISSDDATSSRLRRLGAISWRSRATTPAMKTAHTMSDGVSTARSCNGVTLLPAG